MFKVQSISLPDRTLYLDCGGVGLGGVVANGSPESISLDAGSQLMTRLIQLDHGEHLFRHLLTS